MSEEITPNIKTKAQLKALREEITVSSAFLKLGKGKKAEIEVNSIEMHVLDQEDVDREKIHLPATKAVVGDKKLKLFATLLSTDEDELQTLIGKEVLFERNNTAQFSNEFAKLLDESMDSAKTKDDIFPINIKIENLDVGAKGIYRIIPE